MNKTVMSLLASLLLFTGAGGNMATAAEAPQLMLQMKQSLLAGNIKDGMRLGQGMIISHSEHAGFSIWSDKTSAALRAGHFLLRGKREAAHILKVRLEPKGINAAETPDGQGMHFNTSDTRVSFNIIADGDQSPQADSYTLDINAALVGM